MGKYIITGGTGLVARYAAFAFAADTCNTVIMVVSEERIPFAKELYAGYDNISVVGRNELLDPNSDEDYYGSVVIHTAFTRKNEGEEITRSLDYSFDVFMFAKRKNVRSVIYISSRSVYKEPDEGQLNTESSPIFCSSLIGAAKYATELMLESCFKGSGIKFTSLRISSINELKQDNNMIRPLNVFVDRVMIGESIKVIGGMQVMSFIDPRDVACAIRLVASSDKEWRPVYNVGTGWMATMSLLDMAKTVVDIGVTRGYDKAEIIIEEKVVNQRAGLDITHIKEDFGFEPEIGIERMISDLFNMKEGRIID